MKRRDFLSSSLALAAPDPPVQDDWQGIGRVVAVGDVHGDKDALVAALKMAGLIDGKERWSGGRTHLVQIGDIPARGPQTRQAYDYLMRLEKEAAAAGGGLHALIGNHDAALIYGDLRNVLPEEYGEFRTSDSERLLARAYEEEEAKRRSAGQPPTAAELASFRQSWLERHPPGFVEHREAFRPSSVYGAWIRAHNAVIRINDSLFVHGGISPKYATQTRKALNSTIRKELADPDRYLPGGMATDTQGPLWYRRLSEGEDPSLEPHVAGILRFHGVRRIVTGHVVTRTAIMPRFGGRVIDIDIGLSRFFGRPPACLVLDRESKYVLHRGVRVDVPGPGRREIARYLEAIEAADEKPSPVSQLLRDIRDAR